MKLKQESRVVISHRPAFKVNYRRVCNIYFQYLVSRTIVTLFRSNPYRKVGVIWTRKSSSIATKVSNDSNETYTRTYILIIKFLRKKKRLISQYFCLIPSYFYQLLQQVYNILLLKLKTLSYSFQVTYTIFLVVINKQLSLKILSIYVPTCNPGFDKRSLDSYLDF